MPESTANVLAALTRERDEVRTRADRLAETLREALALWQPIPDAPPEIDATLCRHPRGGELARWRAVLAEHADVVMAQGWHDVADQWDAEHGTDTRPPGHGGDCNPTERPVATAITEPLADWQRDLLTRQQIASDLDTIVGSEQLTAAWLERHRLGGQLAPSPPQVLRAVALDVAAGTLHGRRERFDTAIPPGGYVCAEPDPDGPDGECGMPVEDVPCTIHHPDGAQ